MPEPDGVASLYAVVRGRVQGVGFREFVIARASPRGLRGYVRNLPDGGSVEVVAEGRRAELELLLAHLRKGPHLATVDAVDAEWTPAVGDFPDFGVRF